MRLIEKVINKENGQIRLGFRESRLGEVVYFDYLCDSKFYFSALLMELGKSYEIVVCNGIIYFNLV